MTTVLRGSWAGTLSAALAAIFLVAGLSGADTATLKNGITVVGAVGSSGSIINPEAVRVGGVELKSVVYFDNGLTRTFVPKNQIVPPLGTSPAINSEKISLTQPGRLMLVSSY